MIFDFGWKLPWVKVALGESVLGTGERLKVASNVQFISVEVALGKKVALGLVALGAGCFRWKLL